MKLTLNFEIEKYGLYARLVNESDAEIIVNLRNENRARFMNVVSIDIEKQKEWIREYKLREREGTDYYFLYYKDGIPLGLNRIYNIKNDSYVGGSLVFISTCQFDIPIFATLIQYQIGFEVLDKSICFGNIHKDNKNAIKFNTLFGADFIYEDQDEVFLVTSKKTHFKVKEKFESLFCTN